MDFDGRSGSDLRSELESTLAANKELREEIHGLKVGGLLKEKGFEHVTSGDLKGVPLDKVEAKAAEIEEARRKTAEEATRKLLEKRGFDADEIEEILAGSRPTQVQEEQETADKFARLRDLRDADSQPVGRKQVGEGLHQHDALLAHFNDQNAKTARSRGRRA